MDAQRRSMWPAVRKELRTLGPIWLVAVAGLAAALWLNSPRAAGIGGPFYLMVVVALGAVSMGQEFRFRTLSSFLAQPESRLRLLALKAGVLAVLLGSLVGFVWMQSQTVLHPLYGMPRTVVVIPALCALLLAPWFTMLTRSELAGMLFSAAVPAVLLLAGQTTALLVYGATQPADAPDVTRLSWFVFVTGLVVACAIGGVASVRMFLRLEAIDGGAGGPAVPRWLTIRTARSSRVSLRRSSPYWMLMQKELRLQTLPAGVALLFVLAWTGVWLLRESLGARIDLDTLRGVMSGFYVILTVVLVPASASAGERALDTIAAQTLLPIPASTQWLVKVAAVAGVVIALTFGLMSALTAGMSGPVFLFRAELWWVLAAATTAGLYVSSVNRDALRALVMAIGVGIALALCVTFMDRPLTRLSRWTARALVQTVERGWPVSYRTGRTIREWMPVVQSLLVAVPLFWLAMRNHRSLERGTTRVRRQSPWLVTYLIVVLLLGALADGALNAGVTWAYWAEQARTRQP